MIGCVGKIAVAVGSIVIMTGGAAASTLSPQTWTEAGPDSLCATNDINPNADGCFGLVTSANDSTNPSSFSNGIDLNRDMFDPYPDGGGDITTGMFGRTDWSFYSKSEGGSATLEGVSYTVDENTGIASYFLPDLSTQSVVLAFKQRQDIVFYLFNGDAADGTYDLGTLFDGNSDSLSHLSVYTAPIPLPAAGWLLLTAMGGLGFAARRRRKAN